MRVRVPELVVSDSVWRVGTLYRMSVLRKYSNSKFLTYRNMQIHEIALVRGAWSTDHARGSSTSTHHGTVSRVLRGVCGAVVVECRLSVSSMSGREFFFLQKYFNHTLTLQPTRCIPMGIFPTL